ncbi:hypothetical protein [Pseudobacteroides cellulosolvens]|uniref:Heat shock protein DnaJ domain protein n=1 Tax=Pseudobacteroides cellulosolvens ATCC 35603 = DSM 2933 TaxID=398512 RepID=A0A0L6JNK5_9FIRM|nr:hypothetical protein [Pseudobacteroides cellulosolvens]KNY27388.1 heat shock protein DnaJ domain protein [Pseudobacteroides cellulosolvens ATCC 35603 = DSM 2933]
MGNEELNLMLEKLTKLRDQLVKLNEKTGALDRARGMREEILKVGWKGIMEKYHPDVNTQDPAANELFKMYKFVYEDMKKKMMDM